MVKIDQNIIDQVKGRCANLSVCLSGDMSFCCKVKQGGGDYLVVEPRPNHNPSSCPYSHKVTHEGSDIYVCGCPVRKEIFRKYGK